MRKKKFDPSCYIPNQRDIHIFDDGASKAKSKGDMQQKRNRNAMLYKKH